MPHRSVGKRVAVVLFIAMVCIVSGCTVTCPVYCASGRNVATLRSTPAAVKLGHFTGEQKSVWCRLQPIAPEGDATFASYIRNAFADEMTMAGVAPADAAPELKGTLKTIDVDCGITSAAWVIEMEFTIGAEPPFIVRTVRAFGGNYLGPVVATRAYTAFVPSVQEFVHDVLLHPSFQAAVRAQK